ncbi:glycogen debranching protein GlgX [Lysinibacter cavernae]|uniref:Glycogen operon protein n=1 Tax=Lysinibacter cavernae TaxID=1640652 RepID=A0A7X5QYP2_9MICO|nr:glycogen debranching protein GlgX [Lysinibacter cavernae]NIH52440.1 glycogen operon protein [Lysinibacter cavernae]
MSQPLTRHRLGITRTAQGSDFALWSQHASSASLCLLDERGTVTTELPLSTEEGDVWTVSSPQLISGQRYALRVDGPAGPTHHFDTGRLLLDPYARAVERCADGTWCSVVTTDGFNWEGVPKPGIPLDQTVVYETHVKGFSQLNELLPFELRGTYAGLGHHVSIAYLTSLGITAVELLPVHAFVSEQRLLELGMVNYWGYNSLAFFAPHAAYATSGAQHEGVDAVIAEFKTMVKNLHRAGIEVILDVVYNHTSEEGPLGPTTSFRGIDNAAYYRQTDTGQYIDVTGCGNTVNFSTPAARDLVLDSLSYWANEMQVDGFRFDLAATLGRNEEVEFTAEHPLLTGVLSDPRLQGVKNIAEPWDVGLGGWQTGSFPTGWSEWNDRYRDRMRDFWLTDISRARHDGDAGSGIGRFATRFAGSSNTFSRERGPLASVNFITAHDGFTMADLTAYNVKHNLLNGENNRDGTNNNNSYNHGYEGPSTDENIERVRRKAVRNLMGTLLLSAGVPMMSQGDEFGRTQSGNNNAYCQDNEVSWLPWRHEVWQHDLLRTTQHLVRLRHDNPALRPQRYAKAGEVIPQASTMEWFDGSGESMPESDWNSPLNRTLQYVASSTPEHEDFNRILCVVHALEDDTIVTLPRYDGVTHYELLWDSADEAPRPNPESYGSESPGTTLRVPGTSMRLYRAHS